MKRVVLTVALASVVCNFAPGASAQQVLTPAVAATPTAAPDTAAMVRAAIPQPPPRTVVAPTPTPKVADAPPQERTTTTVSSSTSLDDVPNVRVDVTITYQVGQGAPVKRSASLLVANMEQGSLRSGNQVPVPSTTFVGMASAPRPEGATGNPPPPAGPMTSFTYRSVGLNVDARRVRIVGNRAKLDLSVEFSAIDEKGIEPGGRGTSYPSFPTFSQNLSLVLDNGKPTVIAQTSDVVDNVERKQSVEVKATIVR